MEPMQIIAPSVWKQRWSETEVLDAITWLWLQSSRHQQHTLAMLGQHLLPAIHHRQFALFSHGQQPIGYITWAFFNEAAEQSYIKSNVSLLNQTDHWQCGERMWLIDWFAPFGHSMTISRIMARRLFPSTIAHALHHHGETTGLHINIFKGVAVSPAELAYWQQQNPVSMPLVMETSTP